MDPNSWFFLTFGGKQGQVNWLEMDSQGSVWRRKSGDNSRPTYYLEGAADMTCSLQCDQIAVNTQIQYVKSSR